MNILVYILIIIASLCLGILIGRLPMIKRHGDFIIDDSKDAEIEWTLRLLVDPSDLPNGKNAHFKVIHETQRSCE